MTGTALVDDPASATWTLGRLRGGGPGTPLLRRDVTFLPERGTATVTRMWGTVPLGWPLEVGLHKIAQARIRSHTEAIWRAKHTPGQASASVAKRAPMGSGTGPSGVTFDIPVKFPKLFSKALGEGTSLSFSGSQRVDFSGTSQWTEGEVQTATNRPSKFPSLEMKQQSRFTIEGKVGEKISVRMDQDSERLQDIENNIKIRYDGKEDEIIQEIDLGNTGLNLPGTQFVGFSAQHKGLFGARAKGKFGGLDWTVIASQDKTSGQRKTFRGLAEESANKVRDSDFRQNTYFFLDQVYRERYREFYEDFRRDPTSVNRYTRADSIVSIELYLDDANLANNSHAETQASSGWAQFDDSQNKDVDLDATGAAEQGNFHRLEPETYFVNPALGYVRLDRPLPDQHVLAVVYETWDGRRFGDLTQGLDGEPDQISLKLIKPKSQRKTFPTWDYMWKNVYDLGAREITPEGFSVSIFREPAGSEPQDTQEGVSYLRRLGLDNHDQLGSLVPDNIVDLDPPLVNLESGELFLPFLEPFREADITPQVPEIYDTHDFNIKREASEYFIEIKTASQQTRFNLGQLGIIKGSEVVTVNGKRLTAGSDYSINYETGEVSFFNDEVFADGSDLVIDYEFNPFFAPKEKSLLGLRGEYQLGPQSSVGATLLMNKEKAIERQVRLGEEPTRTVVLDLDGRTQIRPQFISRAIDALPLISTQAPTTINIEGELARSLPNPNTRGQAFIDNFEGRRNQSLGVQRSQWTHASVPSGKYHAPRARLVWYNPFERTPVREIWPDREVSVRDNRINTLTLELRVPPNAGPGPWWGGVMRNLSSAGMDFSRARFLELWVHGDQDTLHVDLGAISEDAIPDDELNTEDKGNEAQRDGILALDEDVGLDGIPNDQERPGNERYDALLPYLLGWYFTPDDRGDDWNYDNRFIYDAINGTEGNRFDTDRGQRPDTEDLNNSGFLNRRNDYYSYKIPLGDPSSPYLVEGDEDGRRGGWRLWRVPLYEGDSLTRVGSPDSTRIEYARLWLEGDQAFAARIAQIEVAENNWLRRGVKVLGGSSPVQPAEALRVTTKNTHENDDYIPPPGVAGERDPLTNVRRREQSLVLQYENLEPGHEASAFRYFKQANITSYRTLRLFVHGDENMAPSDSLEFFLQFGADTTNYYEIRRPIYPGWDERNFIKVDLEELTQVKLGAERHDAVFDDTTGFGKVGDPALSNVKAFSLGVRNVTAGPGAFPATGEVWADELRLTQARNLAGTALRMGVDVSFADVGNFATNLQWVDSEFHDLRTKTGTGSNTLDRNFRVDFKAEKLIPRAWGFQIPVSYSIGSRTALPRLLPGSDIVLGRSEKDSLRTEGDSQNFTVSLSKGQTSHNPFVQLTLERMKFQFARSHNRGRSTQRPFSENTTNNINYSYDLSARKERTFTPFVWLAPVLPEKLSHAKLSYLPQRLTLTSRASRRLQTYADNDTAVGLTSREIFLIDQRFEGRLRPLTSLSADYTLGVKRDLRGSEADPKGFDVIKALSLTSGVETGRDQSFSINLTPNLTQWLRTETTYRTTYGENNNREQRLGGQAQRGRDVNNSRNMGASLTLNLTSLLKRGGGGRSPRSAAADTAEVRNPLWALLGSIPLRFAPLSASIGRSHQARLRGLAGRPSRSFQFGFSDETGVGFVETVTTASAQGDQQSETMNLSGGVDLANAITVRGKYNTADNESQSSSNSTASHDKTFPSLTVRWNGVERLPLFGKLRSLSLDSRFERKSSQRERPKREASPEKLSGMRSTELSPLVGAQARLSRNARATFRLNRSRTETDAFLAGEFNGTTLEETSGFQTSFSYSVQATKGIGFFFTKKKLRLRSSIDFSFGFSWQHRKEERQDIPRRDDVEWSFEPKVSYRFSAKVVGGANVKVGSTHNELTGVNRKTRQVGIWTELRFR